MQSRVSLAKLTLAIALGLAVVAGGWRAVAAFQFNPQPEPPALWNSAPVMVPPGDYLQVNVAYPADPGAFRHPPDPGHVRIQIFDGTGRMLVDEMRDVPAGEAMGLRYNANRIVGGDGTALPAVQVAPDDILRARVSVMNRTLGGMSVATEVGSQETQSSRFAAPGSWVGFNPQPEPPAIGRRFR